MDQREAQRLYQAYAGDLYRYLCKLTGSGQEAEDLVAETFLRAVEHLDRFDGACKAEAWLFTIARNAFFSSRRKKGRATAGPDALEALPDTGPGPAQQAEQAEDRLELYRRIQALEPVSRDVVLLRLSGELSFADIGQLLGKSENWARVTYYRAKEKMKHG